MITLIEEMSFNAVPSLETLFYDGWIIRLSKGYTKRANSVNPLYPSTLDINSKIDKCENLFHHKNLPIIFKLTSGDFHQGLDSTLKEKGYTSIEPTSVRVLDIRNIPSPTINSIKISSSLEDRWLMDYCRFSDISPQHMYIVKTTLASIIPEKYFITLMDKDIPVACGMGVLENNYIGLFNLVVDKRFREKGYGQQLLLNLLNLGRDKGAQYSYLQVMIRNIPAVHLYNKFGFKEKYRYWYRVKL
ncbi:GNAT family N-acetyltransferase [Clostridium thermarum]|uniref:GNAT family N-acetyltransferase n=1 Tax=Clostridium thermarum TaxID=1716543 RepID=UPI00111F2628|nr:GNAT family N-acetyltransferase [Clostridium thermarum]